jgi:hypothetical protein
MSFMDDPEVKRILDTARVMTRAERETAILTEIERLGAADVLQYTLQNALAADSLAEVTDNEFDFAALVAWRVIYKLRANKGALH